MSMDDIFANYLYRTRLYLPLVCIFIALCMPAIRRGCSKAAQWIDGRSIRQIAIVCSVVSFLLCLLVIYDGKSWGGDYSQYFAQARAIATGTTDEWYEKNMFIIDNSSVIGSDVYPWLLALLLVPVYLIFHSFPIPLIKAMGALFTACGSYAFVYILGRRVERKSRVLLLACFVAWNYSYIITVNACEADTLSFCTGMIAVNCVDLYNRMRNKGMQVAKGADGTGRAANRITCETENGVQSGASTAVRYAILSGVTICLAVMTKSLCMGLLLALLAYDIILLAHRAVGKRDRYSGTADDVSVQKVSDEIRDAFSDEQNLPRAEEAHKIKKASSADFMDKMFAKITWNYPLWIRLVPYAVYFLCMRIQNQLLMPSGGSYTDYFTFTWDRFSLGLSWYYGIFSGFFGSSVRPIISIVVSVCGTAFLILVVLGMLYKWREELYMAAYICGMMLMLLFYDYYRMGFVFTVYPLMMIFAYDALHGILQNLKYSHEDLRKVIAWMMQSVTVCALLLTLAQSAVTVLAVQKLGYRLDESSSQDTREAFAYIDEQVDDDEVVYFFKPRVLYLDTNVYSFYYDDDDPERLQLADYVLMSEWNAQPNIQDALEHSGAFQVIYANDRFTLYEKDRE